MSKLLSPFLTAVVFVCLFTSCSSVEADSDGSWSGTWTYQSEAAQLKASLVQRGDYLSGTFEQVFRGSGSPREMNYVVDGIVSDGTATGHLLFGDERHPMKLFLEGGTIRFDVVSWSWKPVLERRAQ